MNPPIENQTTEELSRLLGVLPSEIETAIRQSGRTDDLVEIVMDLGRFPEARFVNGEAYLGQTEITENDIAYVVDRIGDFTSDNRAGIERTLHRISAIRNRQGRVVGLTCRVGRAVYGTNDIIEDIIQSGKSILLLGRPGVGKTTLLREAARVLGDQRRVVIVDTSNEIGGDGDIPHPAVGRARRMQVAMPSLQHEVMIEAVENHMPQVIVIDEIGRELEAAAARTIAERGVQLIGTAHGQTLDNLMRNPTLSDLIGGIQSVTLSDEEARRRGTQKSVLERKAPPTFDVLIEIQDRQRMVIHHNVANAVDAILRGRPMAPELRFRDESGTIRHEEGPRPVTAVPNRRLREYGDGGRDGRGFQDYDDEPVAISRSFTSFNSNPTTIPSPQVAGVQAEVSNSYRDELENGSEPRAALKRVRIYPYGIGQNRLSQAATNLSVPVDVVDELRNADIVMTLKNYYRKRPQPIAEAERRSVPVYVLRSNTVSQMETQLADIFHLDIEPIDPFGEAMQETQEAIARILSGSPSEELAPQESSVRRQQHQLARVASLISHSYGREPRRRVRIYRE